MTHQETEKRTPTWEYVWWVGWRLLISVLMTHLWMKVFPFTDEPRWLVWWMILILVTLFVVGVTSRD